MNLSARISPPHDCGRPIQAYGMYDFPKYKNLIFIGPNTSPLEKDDTLTSTLKKMLTLILAPVQLNLFQSVQFIDNFPPYTNTDDILILYHPRWRETYQDALLKNWPTSQIYVLTIPYEYFWEYCERFYLFDFSNGIPDIQKMLKPESAFFNYLVNYKLLCEQDGFLVFRNWTIPTQKDHTHYLPYVFNSLDLIEENTLAIQKVLSALSDKKSQAIYYQTFFGKPEHIIQNYLCNYNYHLQYFEYLTLEPGDILINGGVEGGHELPFFINQLNGSGTIINIDPSGPDGLTEYSQEALQDNHGITMQYMRYFLDEKKGSINGCDIEALSLEEILQKAGIHHFDALKLDIEGYEPGVIRSAMHLLQKYRPKIAVSVYHAVNHQWQIPELLIDNLPDYNFYYNCYSFTRDESIFYAIPKEKN